VNGIAASAYPLRVQPLGDLPEAHAAVAQGAEMVEDDPFVGSPRLPPTCFRSRFLNSRRETGRAPETNNPSASRSKRGLRGLANEPGLLLCDRRQDVHREVVRHGHVAGPELDAGLHQARQEVDVAC
jgi:hypothetical protein